MKVSLILVLFLHLVCAADVTLPLIIRRKLGTILQEQFDKRDEQYILQITTQIQSKITETKDYPIPNQQFHNAGDYYLHQVSFVVPSLDEGLFKKIDSWCEEEMLVCSRKDNILFVKPLVVTN